MDRKRQSATWQPDIPCPSPPSTGTSVVSLITTPLEKVKKKPTSMGLWQELRGGGICRPSIAMLPCICVVPMHRLAPPQHCCVTLMHHRIALPQHCFQLVVVSLCCSAPVLPLRSTPAGLLSHCHIITLFHCCVIASSHSRIVALSHHHVIGSSCLHQVAQHCRQLIIE